MQDLFTFISHHLALTYALAGVLVALMIVEFLRQKQNTARLDTTRAIQLINHDNAVVIDIRPNDSYRKSHIIDAVSLSARELQDSPKKIEKYRSKPIILVCNAGVESQKVAALLSKQGYNAYSLAGGIRTWIAAELPLIKE